jgi:hypothetical protein
MKIIPISVLLATLLVGVLPTQVNAQQLASPTTKPIIVKPKTVSPVNDFNPDQSIQIKKSQLSQEALQSLDIIQKWSVNNKQLWLVVYREKKESYIFASFNGQVSVFATNPEKGGEYTIPYRTLFTVNPALLQFYVSSQDSTGAYQFKAGFYENYITPLMKIYPNGKLVPGQDNTPPWAIHTPPYDVKGQPSTDLTKAGNSCLRASFAFAKYMQTFALNEIKNPAGVKIYLRRWDSTLQK